jgi:hypothetical protein
MVYIPGSYWQLCDRCGGKAYNTEMVKTWDGLIVHRDTCYDGPRSVLDKPPPLRPETRPRVTRPPVVLWVSKYIDTESQEHILMENGDNLSEEFME